MLRARTHRILPLDADFLPSDNAHEMLKDAYSTSGRGDQSTDLARDFLVVPCFLSKDDAPWPSPAALRLDHERGLWLENGEPLTKAALKRAYQAGEVHPPGSPFALHTHGASNYPLWMARNSSMEPMSRDKAQIQAHSDDLTYSVEYNLWYEPYGVVNKTSWPGVAGEGVFDTRFVDYGGDKVSWSHEAALHGFNFRVHTGVYVIHMPENALQYCDALLPGFCNFANKTSKSWGVRGGGHQDVGRRLNFQFLDHIMSMIPHLQSRRNAGRDLGGCQMWPSHLYQRLSRQDLADLAFGAGRLAPGRKWSSQGGLFLCARDRCDWVHPDLLVFDSLFRHPGALTEAEVTQNSAHVDWQTNKWERVMQRWCLQALPLTGTIHPLWSEGASNGGRMIVVNRFQMLGKWNERDVQHYTEEAIGHLLPVEYCRGTCLEHHAALETLPDGLALKLSPESRCGGSSCTFPSSRFGTVDLQGNDVSPGLGRYSGRAPVGALHDHFKQRGGRRSAADSAPRLHLRRFESIVKKMGAGMLWLMKSWPQHYLCPACSSASSSSSHVTMWGVGASTSSGALISQNNSATFQTNEQSVLATTC